MASSYTEDEVDELFENDEENLTEDLSLEEQIGGGPLQRRRRAPTPEETTPTRLRSTIKTTPKATKVAFNAKDRRAQMAHEEGIHEEQPEKPPPPTQNVQHPPSPPLPAASVSSDPFMSGPGHLQPPTHAPHPLSPSLPRPLVYTQPFVLHPSAAARTCPIKPRLPFQPPPSQAPGPAPPPLDSDQWSPPNPISHPSDPYLHVPVPYQPAHTVPGAPCGSPRPASASLRHVSLEPQPTIVESQRTLPEPRSISLEPQRTIPGPRSVHVEHQVASSKPPEALRHSSASQNREIPVTKVTPATPSPTKSLTGRIPNNETVAIEQSIARMEAMLNMELNNLSVTREQYLKIWLKNDSRGSNYWNTYTEYFKQNLDQELARVPEESSVTSRTFAYAQLIAVLTDVY